MKLQDLVSETVLSLTGNKARSGLTVLGIVVGIASVITMVSIGNGTKTLIENQIQGIGSNLITISPGGETRGAASSGSTDSLTEADAKAVAGISGVAAVAPVIQASAAVSAGSASENVAVTGTSAAYPAVRSVTVASGSWFTSGQAGGAAKVAVLGPDTADTLFGEGSNPVGRRVRVGGEAYTVVGVTVAKGSGGFTNADDAVYVPLATAQRYLAGSSGLSGIYVEAATADGMSDLKDALTSLLLRRHSVTDSADADFSITSQEDIASTLGTVTSLLTLLLGAIAGISLVVGGIGIMNMMLTSVTERIREIGLRKALGSTRSDITGQFLAESVALTVAGGVLGILIGWGLAVIISVLSPLDATVSMSSIALAVGVSTFIGVVFGFYPARRAAKLDAIVALRYQ